MDTTISLSVKKSELIFLLSVAFFLAYIFLTFNLNEINLLLPLTAIISIGLISLFVLIRREGRIEIFDSGLILIGITTLYSSFPLFSLAMNGFEITPLVDNRLKEHAVTASEMGAFAWNHVVYLLSLSFSYLYFRPRKKNIDFNNQNLNTISPAEILIGFIFMIILSLYQVLIPIIFGDSQPYFIKQLTNNFASLFFVMSIWFFAVTLIKRDNSLFRLALVIYLLFEFTKLLLGMSGRTWFALHVIAFALIYHRVIRPFSTKEILFFAPTFIIVFLLFGFIATGQVSVISAGVGFLTGNEEFTAIFSTAYDIHMLQSLGTLDEIPLAVLTFDINNLIPSQLLPFEKIAQTDWYLIEKGLQDDGVGLGFGAIAQGVIGLGKIDLFLRGIITGAFFAYLHKLVNKDSINLWTLVLYIFLAINCYQTVRAGTGYILYFIIYQYLPCFLLIRFLLISANPNVARLQQKS